MLPVPVGTFLRRVRRRVVWRVGGPRRCRDRRGLRLRLGLGGHRELELLAGPHASGHDCIDRLPLIAVRSVCPADTPLGIVTVYVCSALAASGGCACAEAQHAPRGAAGLVGAANARTCRPPLAPFAPPTSGFSTVVAAIAYPVARATDRGNSRLSTSGFSTVSAVSAVSQGSSVTCTPKDSPERSERSERSEPSVAA